MTKPAVERNVDYASISGLTVLRRYDDINFVLKSPDFIPLKGDVPEIGRPFNRGSLLSINGEKHLARRRMYSTLFSNESLSYLYHHAARPVIVEALSKVHEASQDSSAVPSADLAELIPSMLYRVSARVAGIDGIDSPGEAGEFMRILDSYGKGISIEFFENPESFVQECLAGKEEVRTRYLQPCMTRRRELVEAYHAGRVEKSELPRDLITLWLLNDEALLKGESPEQEENLLVELVLFLYTGTRTTQRLLPHVVQGISDWVTTHPEDASKTTESSFLRGAISETLRFHGLPALQRRATKDLVLPSGATIEANEMIALDYVDANRDPEVFGEDAVSWNPYRIDRNISGAPWGMSFGGGAHMCIGRRLVTGGDWRRNSTASDRDIDGTVVAIVRSLFEAGVRPDADHESVSHGQAKLSQFDEYLSYPVVFDKLDDFVSHVRQATTP